MLRAMGKIASSSVDSLRSFLAASVCVVSVVMLLLFPAAAPHRFGAHFRTPEVHRSAERHTSIATGDSEARDYVAPSGMLPKFFVPPERETTAIIGNHPEFLARVPLSRLLNRLKLNSSGSNGQDPLLRA